MIISEFISLLWILAAGILVGFVFDWYRTFRRWRGWGFILTFGGDMVFSLLALYILAVFLEKANSLSFRVYAFAGILLGLLLYIKLFSHAVTSLALKLYWLLERIARVLRNTIKVGLHGLGWLMAPFYSILRWFSLLLYRLGETVFLDSAKLGRQKAVNWWERHFPPRTNG
ncbi:MAG: spore cortex biosynthesis protein YabQ [Desulfitobacteriaceae bacterium]